MPRFKLAEKMIKTGDEESGIKTKEYSLRIDYKNEKYDPNAQPDDPEFELKQQERVMVTFGNHPGLGEVLEADVPDRYARDFKLAVNRGSLEIVPPKK